MQKLIQQSMFIHKKKSDYNMIDLILITKNAFSLSQQMQQSINTKLVFFKITISNIQVC